ncbi:MAG: tRNA lysidine(34) synthetase TilS [Methylacidiphilales bacterium]|nr:tRNA lysidine(34) synthetase TilS [Candidatus Methylacidiphilales bacterium]
MKIQNQAISEKKLLDAVASVCSKAPDLALGLSGGLDSILLAESLLRLGLAPLCLHVNHGWRGRQSDADERWVRRWCREHGLKLLVKRLGRKVPRSEGEARKARWDFFNRAASRHGFRNLCLAHHADDQVETFFLQLLRGAGPEGLAGLREKRRIGSLTVLRPLLCFSKNELLRLARKWKLKWREDDSNKSPDYFRNRVRRRLLPYLKKLSGRDPAVLILRTVNVLAEENAYWEKMLPDKWPEKLSVREWKTRPPAWQRRAMRAWLASRGVGDADFDQIEAVVRLLNREKPSKVNLSRNRFCRRRRGVLFVE